MPWPQWPEGPRRPEAINDVAIPIGQVEAIFRYPVKSMRGEALPAAEIGWYGIAGDRRLALRRVEERGGFPWLTATRIPELIRFTPLCRDDGNGEPLPTHVRAPDGAELPVFGEALAAVIGRLHGSPVEMMHLRHGIFDDAPLSVITSHTVGEISRLAGITADVRRFRPNIVVRSTAAAAFEEDGWLGGVLTFGEADEAPAMAVTMRDVRCAMLNVHPDEATLSPEVMKAVVRANQNNAGIYGTVTRVGRIVVGQPVILHPVRPA